jgi:hypothetical protein
MTDPVDRGRNRSETFAEFARAEGFSLSTFYKLKKLGLGPDVLHVPGTRIDRITPEARQAWRERMAELAKSETAQLEAERRRAQAAEAGKLAAQSPNHGDMREIQRVPTKPPTVIREVPALDADHSAYHRRLARP